MGDGQNTDPQSMDYPKMDSPYKTLWLALGFRVVHLGTV